MGLETHSQQNNTLFSQAIRLTVMILPWFFLAVILQVIASPTGSRNNDQISTQIAMEEDKNLEISTMMDNETDTENRKGWKSKKSKDKRKNKGGKQRKIHLNDDINDKKYDESAYEVQTTLRSY